MMITLEMVDEVIDRTGASYKEAKEALEATEGDVLEAIVRLETRQKKGAFKAGVEDTSQDLFKKLRELVDKGVVNRIVVKKDDSVVLNVPIVAGAISALVFTPATIFAILTALATGCELFIVRDDGHMVNIKDVTDDSIDAVRKKAREAHDRMKKHEEKAGEAAEVVKEQAEKTVDEIKEVFEDEEEI